MYLLIYSNGVSSILKFCISDGSCAVLQKLDALVTSIAIQDGISYFVMDGNIWSLNLENGKSALVVEDGQISLLFFSKYNELNYYSKSANSPAYTEGAVYLDGKTVLWHSKGDEDVLLFDSQSFIPRLTAPNPNDPYYTSLNIFHTAGYGMTTNNGNYTCYAYGHCYENLKSRPNLCTGNAGLWYPYNQRN